MNPLTMKVVKKDLKTFNLQNVALTVKVYGSLLIQFRSGRFKNVTNKSLEQSMIGLLELSGQFG